MINTFAYKYNTCTFTPTLPCCTVMILSFRMDMPGQTVQTQIRLLVSDQGLHCLPFCLHRLDSYSMIEPNSSNFRVITTNFLGVRIFRKFTVQEEHYITMSKMVSVSGNRALKTFSNKISNIKTRTRKS